MLGKRWLLAALIAALMCNAAAFGDVLYGKIVHKDGSKVKKTVKVSTSWNSETAKYTADGEYKLDFKGKVDKKITVYVDGDKYADVKVKGDTRFNIRLTK